MVLSKVIRPLMRSVYIEFGKSHPKHVLVLGLSMYEWDGTWVENSVLTDEAGGRLQWEMGTAVGTDGHLEGRFRVRVGQGGQL